MVHVPRRQDDGSILWQVFESVRAQCQVSPNDDVGVDAKSEPGAEVHGSGRRANERDRLNPVGGPGKGPVDQ